MQHPPQQGVVFRVNLFLNICNSSGLSNVAPFQHRGFELSFLLLNAWNGNMMLDVGRLQDKDYFDASNTLFLIEALPT